MAKILYIATVHRHFIAFHLPYFRYLKEQGHEIHIIANGNDIIEEVDKQYYFPISRSPFSFDNIKALRMLKTILSENKYDLIHCHTAMGSVIGRIASMSERNKNGLKVLYTAHGFHFFKGSPLNYWLLYYPIEKFLSKYTDGIITINNEDYSLIKAHKFRNISTFKINGIGINTEKFSGELNNISEIRERNNFQKGDFILFYVAELIDRKNHAFILRQLGKLLNVIPSLKLVFAGNGRNMEVLKGMVAELGVEENVRFLGYRNDIPELMSICDIYISPSKQEGLPMNICEAMYLKKPIVASSIRGHVDLIESGKTGLLFKSENEFLEAIYQLYNNPGLRSRCGNQSYEKAMNFTLDKTIAQMADIYNLYLK